MSPEEYERYLYEQLAVLRRDYERIAKPLLEELAHLASLKPPPPVYFDLMALPPEQRQFIENIVKKAIK